MRLGKRLEKVELALAARGRADQFHIIQIVPVGWEAAQGRPPGLYRDGSEGSLAGLLVYDPAQGEPVVPEGRLAPWGRMIRCNYDPIQPPEHGPLDEPGAGTLVR
jgi:hypothetical protein